MSEPHLIGALVHVELLRWWKERLGERRLDSLDGDEDTLAEALAALAAEPALYYAGKAKDGSRIWRNRGRRTGATINRFAAALGSVFKFARRKRLTPPRWVSPLKGIEREPESSGGRAAERC